MGSESGLWFGSSDIDFITEMELDAIDADYELSQKLEINRVSKLF